ncbi:MAG: AAA family ATPase, partial [Thermodesulfovibrionales bacterium]|nr:AAA family ATPase [Thermodesulfovibrionales bacterium]
MSLFDKHENIKDPLAYRMSPKTLDEYAGQEHIIGEGKLLRRAIEADRITSLILYGPPGTGKTALAQVIANKTNARFEWLNAATVGLDELRRVIKKARAEKKAGTRTILFLDEIHRFNKLQQDALL